MKNNFKRTKIIATLGPASAEKNVLSTLIKSGLDVIRVNFSHGDPEEHLKNIQMIRELSKKYNNYVAVLADLCGPKIRVGKFPNGSITLKNNTVVSISVNPKSEADIYTDFKTLAKDVKKGERILLDDGNIELTVVDNKDKLVKAKVVRGGILKNNKGMNLPDTALNLPSLTPKDKNDIKTCIKAEVDFIALSFVRTEKNIIDLKKFLKKNNASIPVISKIEKPEALKNIDAIIKSSDGIMIARGDLGVELAPQKVPIIQNQLIELANNYNKPVIVATQILESMIENSRPTRAEVTDISAACFAGADAVMLSGETAVGKYPIQTFEMMKSVLLEIEDYLISVNKFAHHHGICRENMMQTAIAKATAQISKDLNISAIVTLTRTGATAKSVSADRPPAPIIALTQSEKVVRSLRLNWGVYAFFVEKEFNLHEFIKITEEFIVKNKFGQKNDYVILLSGLANNNLETDSIFIHKL